MKYYDYFARHLTKIKRRTGSEYMARCPFHNDRTPSFTFNVETGLWNCFGCGEKGNIYQFLEKMGDKMEDVKSEKEKKKVVSSKAYEYYTIDGNLVYIKTRYQFEDGSKTFKIEWKTEDKRLLLYNLLSLKYNPDIDIIYFAEGEKCVHALIDAIPEHIDNIAVLGYSQAPEKEFDNSNIIEYLKGKEIYIFVDNDEIGEKKARIILNKLKGIAKKVYLIQFNDKPKGYDIADFLSEGKTLEEALLLAKLEYEQHYEDIDIFNLLMEGVEDIEFIDEEFKIPKGVLALVAGIGSVGKGYFLLYLSLKWILKGLNVCYITAEDDIKLIKKRILSLIPKIVRIKEEQKGKFRIYELVDEDLLSAVETAVRENFDVIIVDPLSFLLDEENANAQVAKVMRNLQVICKRKEINIILSHHLRKYSLKEIKDKFDMLDAIRGAGSLHNNARYVLFLRRNKDDNSIVEIYNAKNSYAPNDNDYKIEGLFPSTSDFKIEKISSIETSTSKKSSKGGISL